MADDGLHPLYTAAAAAGGNLSSAELYDNVTVAPPPPLHAVWEVTVISLVVIVLCVATAGGNLLVMVSFRVERSLQTVSNYFLLSLSVADFAIGVVSMPLFSMYLLLGVWPLGQVFCDVWLSIDYTMSNASVANLLIICFDRYFSVTKPLTYRARRTPKKAGIMITCAWVISALLWTPWIMSWPYIEKDRRAQDGPFVCTIQFLSTNQYITIITAVIAFYLPVIIMCILYYKIYLETQQRQKDMKRLQADRYAYHNTQSSDEEACLTHTQQSGDYASSPDPPETPRLDLRARLRPHRHCLPACLDAVKRCCNIDRDAAEGAAEDDSSSDVAGAAVGAPSPAASLRSARHHVVHGAAAATGNTHRAARRQDSSASDAGGGGGTWRNSHGTGQNVPLINGSKREVTAVSQSPRTSTGRTVEDKAAANSNVKPKRHEVEAYTIVIKLPTKKNTKPTIQMIQEPSMDDDTDTLYDEDDQQQIPMRKCDTVGSAVDEEEGSVGAAGRRATEDMGRVAAAQAATAARLAAKAKDDRARKKRLEKRQDKKAAKTLSAILLAFIITWTPYNLFTLVNIFCTNCVDETLYNIGYWLCYINSTINPICYALCNANFRRTFWRVLTCRARRRRPPPPPRYTAGSLRR